MHPRRTWQNQWAIGIGAATFIALILGAHSYAVFSYTGETAKWEDQFSRTAVTWFLWAAFFPVILRLAREFRFAGTTKLKSAAIHLFAGAGIAIVHYAAQLVINDWLLNPKNNWNAVILIFEGRVASMILGRFFFYSAIVMISVALESYHRARQTEIQASELEAGILQSQVESLTTQLDPEFLFQSLRELSCLMRTDLDAADSMVAQLGDYLRMKLDYCKSSSIRLREEIELVKCYVEIQNSKGKGRTQIDFEIDPGISELRVPIMILQAPVEDAVDSGTASDVIRRFSAGISVMGMSAGCATSIFARARPSRR